MESSEGSKRVRFHGSFTYSQKQEETEEKEEMTTYGYFLVLGHSKYTSFGENLFIPKGEMNEIFKLKKRQVPNGVSFTLKRFYINFVICLIPSD